MMRTRTGIKWERIVALTALASVSLCLSQTSQALTIKEIEADFAPTKGVVVLPDNSTLPITVRLHRDGNEPAGGEVRVRVVSTGSFPAIDVTQKVRLREGNEDTFVHFSVRVPLIANHRSVPPLQKLRVQVTDSEDKSTLTENESDLVVREAAHDFRLLILSSDPTKKSLRKLWKETDIHPPSPDVPPGTPGSIERAVVTHIMPEGLPEQVGGYDTVSAVILYGDNQLGRMNLLQWEALRLYVRGGGILVLPGWDQFNEISSSLSFVSSRTDNSARAAKINEFIATDPVQKPLELSKNIFLRRFGLGGVLCYQVDPLNSVVGANSSGQPPVSSSTLTVSPSELREKTRSLADAYRLLHKSHFSPIAQLHTQSLNNYVNTLEDSLAGDSAAKTPPFEAVAGFVFLYIGLLVPANYLILKRLGKRELAWLTVPLLAVQFSGGAYALGRTLKTSPMTAHRVSVLETYANSKNDFAGYGQFSIYSDRRTKLQISTKGTTLVPLPGDYKEVIDPPRFSSDQTNGMGGKISEFSIRQWEAKRFETTLPDFPYIGEGVNAKMSWKDGNATVTLTNKTNSKLKNGFIVLGDKTISVPEMTQGQTETMRFAWSGRNPQPGLSALPKPTGLDARSRLQRDLISCSLENPSYEGYVVGSYPRSFSYGTPTAKMAAGGEEIKPFAFVAWFDRSPFEVKVDGKLIPGESANLLYVHLDDIDPLHPLNFQNSDREKN